MRLAESSRAQQTTVMVSTLPTLNMATSPVFSEGQTKVTKRETNASGNLTGDPPKGSHYPPSEFDIEVHIDRSTTEDPRQPGGEPIDRDSYATPQSLCDRAEDDRV